ncbi:MAG: AmmeMemoRadiSam system radical SAM enzyme [Desulfovibrionaceae bacterium]|nr:AmmeMemoRadiSam system radical SAM enzyme [Desulfovibrionaceae bacterium]
MLDALLWLNIDDTTVECLVCGHHCRLKNGMKGRCGVRVNKEGKLFSVVTDLVSSIQMDPIEKKPLYHFLPGTRTFSIGSVGCNFRCKFCQNDHISVIPKSGIINGKRTSARSLIDLAIQYKSKSIAFTYNEPTIFIELINDASELAFAHKIPVILVSNGFMSTDFLDMLANRVQAVNIDLKSFREDFYREYCGGHLRPVLDSLKRIRKMGWWLEVTTLVIHGLNDSPEEIRDCARFIRDELGADVPWHLSAFHPAYLMQDRADTSLEQLQAAWSIGKEEGLEYVYLGNVGAAVGGNTYCPQCSNLVAERSPWKISFPASGKCPKCGHDIPGVWH